MILFILLFVVMIVLPIIEVIRIQKFVKKLENENAPIEKSQLMIYLNKSCPPHAWQYDANGRMKCERCKNHPFEGNLQ